MENIEYKLNKDELINEFLRHFGDIVPYDDPEYESKIMQLAEEYADNYHTIDESYRKYCEEHPETLESYNIEDIFSNNDMTENNEILIIEDECSNNEIHKFVSEWVNEINKCREEKYVLE